LQPETISALQDLVSAGKSVAQAAKHLGIGRSTAYKAIRNATPQAMFRLRSSLAWFYEETFRWGLFLRDHFTLSEKRRFLGMTRALPYLPAKSPCEYPETVSCKLLSEKVGS
jgi:hypothetical protein